MPGVEGSLGDRRQYGKVRSMIFLSLSPIASLPRTRIREGGGMVVAFRITEEPSFVGKSRLTLYNRTDLL